MVCITIHSAAALATSKMLKQRVISRNYVYVFDRVKTERSNLPPELRTLALPDPPYHFLSN